MLMSKELLEIPKKIGLSGQVVGIEYLLDCSQFSFSMAFKCTGVQV